MTIRPIGYYVHHHGAGHIKRARALASAADGRIILLGTDVGAEGIDLPDDRLGTGQFDGLDSAACRPDALHYAPLDHEGIRGRVAAIAKWIEAARPALMVVDVSAEIAMLARLASVPVIYVRLNGDRTDAAHLESFRGASGLLAPFHEALELGTTPQWVKDKTRYFPGITTALRPSSLDEEGSILVVIGQGGATGDSNVLAEAARATPGRHWRVIGPCTVPRHCPSNLQILGWVKDPDVEIAKAALVIGGAGDGLVTAVLACRRPFICIPQLRPFGEQHATAQRLGELGAAVTLANWPHPETWLSLFEEARNLQAGAPRYLHDPLGVCSAANWIVAVADTASGPVAQAA